MVVFSLSLVLALLSAETLEISAETREIERLLQNNGAAYELLEVGTQYANFTSDKFSYHNYESMYGQFISTLRDIEGVRLLEVGLGCDMQYGPGASARFWRAYLPKAELWFAEMNGECVRQSQAHGKLDGISVLVGDQRNLTDLLRWVDSMRRPGPRGGMDVIVDDGSHKNSHMLLTFDVLWNSALNPGGVYVIEDLYFSRKRSFDDTYGTFVMADVLSSWSEQLMISPCRSQERFRSNPWRTTDAAEQAWGRARRFPLPNYVKAVYCQSDACAILSCSAADRVAQCIRPECERQKLRRKGGASNGGLDGIRCTREWNSRCCPSQQTAFKLGNSYYTTLFKDPATAHASASSFLAAQKKPS